MDACISIWSIWNSCSLSSLLLLSFSLFHFSSSHSLNLFSALVSSSWNCCSAACIARSVLVHFTKRKKGEWIFCIQWVVAYASFSLFLHIFSSVVHDSLFPFPLLSQLEKRKIHECIHMYIYITKSFCIYIWEWCFTRMTITFLPLFSLCR